MEYIQFHLQVTGIFGRNRKPKFEQFLLAEVPIGQAVDPVELERLAREKMAEVKVKSGRVKVTQTPTKIEVYDGIEFRTHTIRFGVDNTVIDLGSV
ncbi:MAG TPA: hypothetical protein VE954_43260 [Oligoflexus sp.]|uniref:hypothetical protein n=1 Tax=Oligoflexus sp. TaxID=1971216 RepID=UPI002D6E668C|nr:hypothetical protein [Oligoflexus sp.]HYX39964.1 hypothetical protein [Oligoflexus sp.]